jgi:hypothetical protein
VPEELAFPCVVKPRVGSNSRGVRVIRTVDEWESWLDAHADEKGWEIEEFIDAPMCFVDGLGINADLTGSPRSTRIRVRARGSVGRARPDAPRRFQTPCQSGRTRPRQLGAGNALKPGAG